MENIPALLIRTCKGPKRAFHSWANLATESNERRSSSITFKNKINKKHKKMQIYERERERERENWIEQDLNIERESQSCSGKRPLVLPIEDQLVSSLSVPDSHDDMCPCLRQLPSGFTANAAGGAGDYAGEIVEAGRQRHRVVQVACRDPLEQHFVYQIHPTSQPFYPSQTLFLLLLPLRCHRN